MKAVVLKNIGIPSTGAAYFVNKLISGFECYGSAVMNICNCGINPSLIEDSINNGDGARIVSFQ